MQKLRQNLSQIKENLVIAQLRLNTGKQPLTSTLFRECLEKPLTYNLKNGLRRLIGAELRGNTGLARKEIKELMPFVSFQLDVVSQYSEKRKELKNTT